MSRYHSFLKVISFLLTIFLISCGGGAESTNDADNTTDTITPDVITPDEPSEDDGTVEPPISQSPDAPNILFIISDDQGIDSSAEYEFSLDTPHTPNLSALANSGVIFENVWSSPSCSPTRAAIMTGKYGINSGVTVQPGDIREEDQTLFEFLAEDTDTSSYATALFGKWNIGGNNAPNSDPVDNGVPYYAGTVQGNVNSYTDWQLTIDSLETTTQVSTSDVYITTELTRLASEWIADQTQPWFVWLAHTAPHSPFHWPDASLHTQGAEPNGGCDLAANRRTCYLAMTEAMDTEIGHLLDSLPEATRNNTIVLFTGDNGSPNAVRDPLVFNAGEVKGSLHEGGVRVPFFVSGAGVTRQGARENRLTTVTDIYATIAELAGSEITSIYDSLSLASYLSSDDGERRSHSYTDYTENGVDAWTIRNQNYQLISLDGEETLLQINEDSFNTLDVSTSEPEVLYELQVEGAKIRNQLDRITASPQDMALDITEGSDNGIFTLRASTCARFVRAYTALATNLNGTTNNTADD